MVWSQALEPAGVRLIEAEAPAGPLAALRRAVHHVGYGIERRLIAYVLRKGLSAYAAGPEATRAYVRRWREWHARPAASSLQHIEAAAVRVSPPYQGLAGPPAPSDWFAPHKGEPKGFVFYVHGGSFVAERSPKITAMVAKFAAQAGARVFAPSYRLAPEHPCPAAVDDIEAAFRWFRDEWPEEPVVALAESAGASILLAALLRIRDAGGALPDGIMLLSPWVDLALQSWSVIAASLAGTSPHTMESLALMAHLYLQGQPPSARDASPLYGDFAGFPPMLIHASRTDILHDDAVRLADRVREAGGDLTVRLWEAETHVWEQTGSPAARQSIDLACSFIRRCLD